jgi:transcriptional regulator with XRE-family HTH domain
MATERQDTSPHGSEVSLTDNQCRMARAGLSLGVRDLAAAAKVSTNTITRFERGEAIYPRTAAAIRAALEAAGVEFIPADGGGAGVRLRSAS